MLCKKGNDYNLDPVIIDSLIADYLLNLILRYSFITEAPQLKGSGDDVGSPVQLGRFERFLRLTLVAPLPRL